MPRFARALSALLLVVMAATLAPQGAAAQTPSTALSEAEAIELLQRYRIVLGDERGDLQLNAPLTRAQAAAIFVRAMGASELTSIVVGPPPFSDVAGHWGVREITLASRLGLMQGHDGQFRPDDLITHAEVLTVLLRMLEQPLPVPWTPESVFQRAQQMGIAPAGAVPTAPALRRHAFWSLAAALTTVPVGEHPNLAAKYLDVLPPSLVIDPMNSVTYDEKVRISGRAPGAIRVLVAGAEAEFDPVTDIFSHEAELNVGLNQITVEAVDAAGNKTTQVLTLERRGAISRISISGPKTLATETAVKLDVTATDRSGNVLPLYDVEAEVTGVDATFDPSTATLVTGNQTGKGTLTLRAGSARASYSFTVVTPSAKAYALKIDSINKNLPLATGEAYTVTVRVVDKDGKNVTDDYGRVVSLVSTGTARVTLTPDSPVTDRGVATFTVVGDATGYATLTATAAGLEPGTLDIDVLTGTRVVLVPSVKSLAPDGTSTVTIKAQLQDERGRRITNNTPSDIRVRLSASGPHGGLTDTLLVIARGKSDTGSEGATLKAGITPGTVIITGEFVSDHDYAVQALRIPIDSPLAGSRFRIEPSSAAVKPGSEVTLTLEVVDGSGRVVKEGAYAFQLRVRSSNHEATYRGLPQGVSLTFEDSPFYPVDDGYAPGDPEKDPYSVIGRTYEGRATFTLRYHRSGVITVEVIPLPATDEAYHPVSGAGPAASSTFLWAQPQDITFRGSAAGVVLTVDSSLGQDREAGAIGGSGTLTLTAKVVDEDGVPLPDFNGTVRLRRLPGGDGVTTIQGLFERKASAGRVTFTLAAQNRAGFDQYEAEVPELGLNPSKPVTVSVRREPAPTPVIVAIRGTSDDDPVPTPGYVGPEADYMEIQLASVPAPQGEPSYWVLAEVYQANKSSPIYSQVIDLSQEIPVIRVPRSHLSPGTARYQVTIHNGYARSAKSATLDPVTEVLVAGYGSKFQLRGASYDAATGRLLLTTSGLASTGTLDPARLTLVGPRRISLADAEVVSITSSRVILDLGELADELTPDQWHGRVELEAESGWFVDKSGSGVADRVTGIAVTPMATISSAMLDVVGKRLYIDGVGLKQGTVSWTQVKINSGDKSVALRSADRVHTHTDTQAILNLSDATLKALLELSGPEVYLTAEEGWIRTGSGSSLARGAALTGTERPVRLRILATAAVYDPATGELTLRGAGFKGMTLHPDRLLLQSGPGAMPPEIGATPPVTAGEDQDDHIVIPLHPDDADLLRPYAGNNVYINTEPGWLTDANGWEAAPLPAWSLLVHIPASPAP